MSEQPEVQLGVGARGLVDRPELTHKQFEEEMAKRDVPAEKPSKPVKGDA